MLFEKYLSLDTPRLIRLSQMRADESPEYPENFEQLFQDILEADCIIRHPLFEWGGIFSTCWRLERARVWQGEVDRLFAEAEEADGKTRYALLGQCEQAARKVCENITEWKQRLESTRIPLLHPRFALAQLLRVHSARYEASWKCVHEQKDSEDEQQRMKQTRMRRASSLRAFQAYDLAHNLWRVGSDPNKLKCLKEAAHHEIARGASEFQEVLNHASQSQTFTTFWESVQGKNEVWRLEPEECSLRVWSVQDFLDIYQPSTS